MSKKRLFKRDNVTLEQVNELFSIKKVLFTDIDDRIMHCLIVLGHDNNVSGEYTYKHIAKKAIRLEKIDESNSEMFIEELKEHAKEEAFKNAFSKIAEYHQSKIFKAITGKNLSK